MERALCAIGCRCRVANSNHIQVIKKLGGSLRDSYLEEGFLLDGNKLAGVGQPWHLEQIKK